MSRDGRSDLQSVSQASTPGHHSKTKLTQTKGKVSYANLFLENALAGPRNPHERHQGGWTFTLNFRVVLEDSSNFMIHPIKIPSICIYLTAIEPK